MGQHSPDGMIGSAHSLTSSQIISSHSTDPLSHTQIRHGSGFHTSLSLQSCPSWVQPPACSVVASRGREAGEHRNKCNEKTERLVSQRNRKMLRLNVVLWDGYSRYSFKQQCWLKGERIKCLWMKLEEAGEIGVIGVKRGGM